MYFSDVFCVSNDLLAAENVFDISLVSDLPLFIDPFLIFDSEKPEYQRLHKQIIRYVSFLRDKIVAGNVSATDEREWFHFPEIPNNWLGYSVGTNAGRGLGENFARAAAIGLKGPVRDFGEESVSRGSHIERLFLFSEGAGKDALSDFITNLCHEFLLQFTQEFTKTSLRSNQCREFDVRRVRFDYGRERWANGKFLLPVFKSEYILLTPLDLLTQSVPWINRPDLFDRFGGMLEALSDSQLRGNVNTFLRERLVAPPNHPKDKEYRPSKADVHKAYARALELYPDLANWYVAEKESSGDEAVRQSKRRVSRADELYRARVLKFIASTLRPSGFFEIDVKNTARLLATFTRAIEQDGRDLFVGEDGLLGELSSDDVRLMCTLAWRGDGNDDRPLPDFRFVHDSKSEAMVEAALSSKRKEAGMLVVSTDRSKKKWIELLVADSKLSGIGVASITGGAEEERTVESVFISYTKVDENWARWIGRVLMSAGYTVTVQYKDFLPGTNFVQQMDQAIKTTDRTVAVLSPDYLKSSFAEAEWQAAFRDDPLGQKRKLVPIRVAKVNPSGLLGSIVYADIVGLTEESATAVLLGALSAGNRPTPTENGAPFPGSSSGTDKYQVFLSRLPHLQKGKANPDASRRLKAALAIQSLSTDKVNVLIYALNPPENQIPPVNSTAKDRAAALLDWSSREQIDLSAIEELINSLQG